MQRRMSAGLSRSMPQGLKPRHSAAFIGTTEVVPFHKTFEIEFFRTL